MDYRILRTNSQADFSTGIMFSVILEGIASFPIVRQMCHTLEDESREVKVMEETRIPADTYELTLRTEGKLTKRYEARFPRIHEGMIWINDVPNFVYIYVHCGNDDEDTDGCVLVGEYSNGDRILNSRAAYRIVYPMIRDSIKSGKTYLEIIDYDTPPETQKIT